MTAIEWLEMEIVKLETKYAISGEIYQLCEQAKEIEKEQIITAYNRKVPFKFGKEYYNETFNNED